MFAGFAAVTAAVIASIEAENRRGRPPLDPKERRQRDEARAMAERESRIAQQTEETLRQNRWGLVWLTCLLVSAMALALAILISI